jgi:SPP1 gp7 family putative phage head morphogenesis protein
MASKNLFTEDEQEDYLLAVYSGLITTYTLSINYHEKVGGKLYGGVLDGWGKIGFKDAETEILAGLTENIYAFSAAKQYQQVRDMSRKVSENITFKEFREFADDIFGNYNESYLKTEFETAIEQSQNARKWAQVQGEKDTFPLLKYKTQQDDLVRHDHAELNNVIKPVDDPFWDTHMPANGWRCRCFVQQIEEGEITKDPPTLTEAQIPPLFRMNAGKDKLIFDPKKHPYFVISKGDAQLKKDNFNLPIP